MSKFTIEPGDTLLKYSKYSRTPKVIEVAKVVLNGELILDSKYNVKHYVQDPYIVSSNGVIYYLNETKFKKCQPWNGISLKENTNSEIDTLRDELYSEIEQTVISWNTDGTKTAGHLTREVLNILDEYYIHKKNENQII